MIAQKNNFFVYHPVLLHVLDPGAFRTSDYLKFFVFVYILCSQVLGHDAHAEIILQPCGVLNTEIDSREHTESFPEINPTLPLRLAAWNTYKQTHTRFTGELQKLVDTHDLILLQESILGNSMDPLTYAHFGMSFSFFKSFDLSPREHTGVLTMSRWRSQDRRRILTCDYEPFAQTPKVTGYTSYLIHNGMTLHVLNIHALNFNLGSKFKKQIEQVHDFIQTREGPVIFAGDFNTWTHSRWNDLESILSRSGFKHVKPTSDPRYLALDHVFVRGLTAESLEVLTDYQVSDHYPLSAVLHLDLDAVVDTQSSPLQEHLLQL